MAAEIITSLVLLCSALTLPAVAQLTFGDCNLNNATTSNNYTFSVNPTAYKINSTYTVTLNGSINTTRILFQVVNSPNSFINGAWEDGNLSCNGTFFEISDNQTSLVKKWTSPTNNTITNVTIWAYVRTNSSTVMMSFPLTRVLDGSSTTTIIPAIATTSKMSNSTPALLSSSNILGFIQIVVLAVFYHLTS